MISYFKGISKELFPLENKEKVLFKCAYTKSKANSTHKKTFRS